MPEFKSDIDVCTKVLIDRDKSIIGTVTAVIFRVGSVNYEVSYMYNGSSYAPIIEGWRVTRAPDR